MTRAYQLTLLVSAHFAKLQYIVFEGSPDIIEVLNPTTPPSLALCLSALPMREIRLVIAPLDPGHEGKALLNRIRMQG